MGYTGHLHGSLNTVGVNFSTMERRSDPFSPALEPPHPLGRRYQKCVPGGHTDGGFVGHRSGRIVCFACHATTEKQPSRRRRMKCVRTSDFPVCFRGTGLGSPNEKGDRGGRRVDGQVSRRATPGLAGRPRPTSGASVSPPPPSPTAPPSRCPWRGLSCASCCSAQPGPPVGGAQRRPTHSPNSTCPDRQLGCGSNRPPPRRKGNA